MTAPEVPALAPDLELGLRRLKLRAIRSLAPEVLQTAKVQRWAPDELLRTLVDAEINARDQANEASRRRQAGFPVAKSIEEFKVAESSIPRRPSTTSRLSNGSLLTRTWSWSALRAPARATCSSASAMPLCGPANESATSPRRLWWRRSIADLPTTASGG